MNTPPTGPQPISLKKHETVLFIGGIRSGKSRAALVAAIAHSRATQCPSLFVATGHAADEEMKSRINRHRDERPESWETWETTDLVGALHAAPPDRLFLADCLGGWATALLTQTEEEEEERRDGTTLPPDINSQKKSYKTNFFKDAPATNTQAETARLAHALTQRTAVAQAPTLIVTNEVGLSLVPLTPLGRRFSDLLGEANQAVSASCHRVLFFVAGRYIAL